MPTPAPARAGGGTARGGTGGSRAVIEKFKSGVEGGLRVGGVDLGQDGVEALVAAGVAREDGGEQLRGDLGKIGSGRRWDEGEAGDFHARNNSRKAG